MLTLLRFHLRSTVRLALRALTPIAGALVAASVLANQPGAVLVGLAAGAVGRDTHPAAALVVLAILFPLAAWMARRTTHGLAGWARSLPCGDRSQLDAAAAAIALALLPIPAVLAAIDVAAGLAVSPARTLGLAVAAGAAALAALPVERRRTVAALCVGAGWLMLEAGWIGLLSGLLLVAAARWLCAEIQRVPPPRQRLRHGSAFLPLIAVVAWRALGARILGPVFGAGMVALAAAVFLTNNQLEPAVAAGAERLAALSAVTLVIAGIAELLAVRRPAWPWARSLPQSAMARVGGDTALLFVATIPVLAVAAASTPGPALVAAAATPTVAALAAGAIRRAAVRASGASGEVLAGGLLAAAWTALVPAVAAGVLVLLPLVLGWAAERERSLKSTAWQERHHLAAGDPLAWSDR